MSGEIGKTTEISSRWPASPPTFEPGISRIQVQCYHYTKLLEPAHQKSAQTKCVDVLLEIMNKDADHEDITYVSETK